MEKTTKGAVAAAIAGALLLGGAGSLAYWSDSDDVTGSTFNAGSLSLAPAGACNVWNLDTGEPGGQPFDPSTDTLVPGDVVSKVCTFTVDAVGEHLRATVTAQPGTDSGALLPELAIDTDLAIGANPVTEITDDDDGATLSVTVTVSFDPASTNASQTDSAVLDDIAIVTSQVHA
jgi:alternate signal-mediated exported protein